MSLYPSYKDSGVEWVGDIPQEWLFAPLKYYFNFTKGVNGQKLTKSYIDEHPGEYPVYSGMTQNEGVLGLVDEYEFDYNFPIVFTTTVGAKSMTTKLLNGRFSLSQNCLIMIRKKSCEPSFVQYFLSYDFLYHKILLPTILQPSLRMEDLDTYRIALPPLPEQRQIVTFLDSKTQKIDNLIELTEQKIELLKEQRTALINQCVTKGLNPNVEMKDSGVEWIGEIPKHWNTSKAKYLSSILPSNIDKHIKAEEIQVFLCNYTDVYYNEHIDSLVELKKGSCNQHEFNRFKLQDGDVIITKDSESADDIGIPTLVVGTFENVVCGYHLTMLRPFGILGNYLFRFIQSHGIRKYFEINSDGITRFGLGKSTIENMVSPLPPLQEQQQIAHYLDKETTIIDTIIEKEAQRIELLKEYRQALISEVVTGKIDVRGYEE